MSSEYKFGIDLGTTNSAVARSNGIEVYVYQHNDQNVTPSAVHILRSGRILVGKCAYNAVVEDPENVATEFKRSMGQKVSKTFLARGRAMSPEELSAEILKSLLEKICLRDSGKRGGAGGGLALQATIYSRFDGRFFSIKIGTGRILSKPSVLPGVSS